MSQSVSDTRRAAAKVAKVLVAKNRTPEALEVLCAWAVAGPNDSEGQALLADALQFDGRGELAKMAFQRMEGIAGEYAALDAALAKYTAEEVAKLDRELTKPVFRRAQLGFNNDLKYKGRVFHVQTEDSGLDKPHVITHLFADGGRIIRSFKRTYTEHVEDSDVAAFVKTLMKGQHMEMVLALRDGKFDGIVEGREHGGMLVLEHPPAVDIQRLGNKGARKPDGAPASVAAGAAAAAGASPAAAPQAGAAAGPAVATGAPAPAAAIDAAGDAEAAAKAPAPSAAPATPKVRHTTGSAEGLRALVSTPPRPTPAVAAAPTSSPKVRFKLHVLRSMSAAAPDVYAPVGDEAVIGAQGEISLPGDPFCHPREAAFRYRDGQLWLDDLDGGNGVFLRIRRPVELAIGDEFIVGDQLLRIDKVPTFDHTPAPGPTYCYSSPVRVSSFRVLQIFEGGAEGGCILARGTTLYIGAGYNDMIIRGDSLVSEHHCLLDEQAGAIILTDLGSKTGVFVRVHGQQELHHGDEIMIGRSRLLLDTKLE